MDNKQVVLRESFFEKCMHFFVHNSFLFTSIFLFATHILLMIAMIYANVTPLIIANIFSLLIYLFCILLCHFGHPYPVYISIIAEVSIYVILATYFIGWGSGSICFLCGIVPVIIFFGYNLLGINHRFLLAILLVSNFAIYVILYINCHKTDPLYIIPDFLIDLLCLLASFVMVFSTVFYSIIYIFSAEFKARSLELQNEQLTKDASTDALTKLLNRRSFISIINELMQQKEKYFCIAFCDIDNFKQVNDNYGHDGGDEVLKHVTKIIRKEMTGCNICRWGGEEIVILMKDYDFEVAKSKMEYIRKTIEQSGTVFYNKRINVTLTIGIEEYRNTYNTADEIITVADKRMYFGKQHGKNTVIFEDRPEVVIKSLEDF